MANQPDIKCPLCGNDECVNQEELGGNPLPIFDCANCGNRWVDRG